VQAQPLRCHAPSTTSACGHQCTASAVMLRRGYHLQHLILLTHPCGAGNDEVAALFVVRSEAELAAYTAEALAPGREAARARVLPCCRSLTTASLTELSLSKGGALGGCVLKGTLRKAMV
jgi:hypothetical protein